jgi:hypothetical protein
MSPRALIDTNAFLGAWPFTIAPELSASQLTAHLARSGIQCALVSHLGAVLHPDPMPSNGSLFAAVRRQSALIAVPILNPILVPWQEQLDTCRKEVRPLRAVRLLPNYHNYTLRTRRLDGFMAALADQPTRVILSVRLEDERHKYFGMGIKGVNPVEIALFLKRYPRHHLMLAGCYLSELEWLAGQCDNFTAEISFAEAPLTVRSLSKFLPLRRLMFGSAAPLMSVAAQSAKILQSQLPRKWRTLVARDNAYRFFSL